MSTNWLESLEEHIANFIDEHDLEPDMAWEEIRDMANDNITEMENQDA